ncbi:MAG: hypothetical protein K2I46_00365 [Clostridia bacterium]|nr:hypothetical protein [Clostridia bacterium]
MKTKKYAKIITAILLVSLLALTLFACFDSGNDSEGTMTLVLLNGDDAKEYVVDMSKLPSGNSQSTGLVAILDYLQDDGQLTYSIDNGGLLNQVGDLEGNNNKHTFISIYTSVTKDISVAEWAQTVTYKDVKCTSSARGASEMSILADCVIILSLETW